MRQHGVSADTLGLWPSESTEPLGLSLCRLGREPEVVVVVVLAVAVASATAARAAATCCRSAAMTASLSALAASSARRPAVSWLWRTVSRPTSTASPCMWWHDSAYAEKVPAPTLGSDCCQRVDHRQRHQRGHEVEVTATSFDSQCSTDHSVPSLSLFPSLLCVFSSRVHHQTQHMSPTLPQQRYRRKREYTSRRWSKQCVTVCITVPRTSSPTPLHHRRS